MSRCSGMNQQKYGKTRSISDLFGSVRWRKMPIVGKKWHLIGVLADALGRFMNRETVSHAMIIILPKWANLEHLKKGATIRTGLRATGNIDIWKKILGSVILEIQIKAINLKEYFSLIFLTLAKKCRFFRYASFFSNSNRNIVFSNFDFNQLSSFLAKNGT